MLIVLVILGNSNWAPPSIIVKFLTLECSTHSESFSELLYHGSAPYTLIMLRISGASAKLLNLTFLWVIEKSYGFDTFLLKDSGVFGSGGFGSGSVACNCKFISLIIGGEG